jgi:hypothetical protein
MDEKITALYTNLYDARDAQNYLNSNGLTKININPSEFGLHNAFPLKHKVKAFPGAIVSTVVKLEVDLDNCDKNTAVSLVEKSFGVID